MFKSSLMITIALILVLPIVLQPTQNINANQPTQEINTYIEISAGSFHSCGITPESTVQCWGENQSGQLGTGDTTPRSRPVDVINLNESVHSIAVGDHHTCVLTSVGSVKCWGSNAAGQLGNGSNQNSFYPVTVGIFSDDVVSITADYLHNCAIRENGSAYCWGANWFGQLGDKSNISSGIPVQVEGLDENVLSIDAGFLHTCALLDDDGTTIKCWGNNGSGQLGDDTTDDRNVPAEVVGLDDGKNLVAIKAGGSHTCTLDYDGNIYCWGNNESGQLGDGTFEKQLTPVMVDSPGIDFQALDAGGLFTCAVSDDSASYCWGHNQLGQLGNGQHENQSTPDLVVGLEQGVDAMSTANRHACALLLDGTVKCWGDNTWGYLGQSDLLYNSLSLFTPEFSGPIATLGLGRFHACALTNDGTAKCWGDNYHGQLGSGDFSNRYDPVYVTKLDPGILAIDGGNSFTCALTSDGAVKCWGYNWHGQLGNGETTESGVPEPVQVIGLNSGVTSIVVGGLHTCALVEEDGQEVKCWGSNNNGQLGDGSKENSTIPVPVNNLGDINITQLVTGGDNSCVLTDDERILCWGEIADSTTPVEVLGENSNITKVVLGSYHMCGIKNDQSMVCWGLNEFGQLGNASNTDSSVPVDVYGMTDDVIGASLGSMFSCALTSNGAIQCWGHNNYGQLGDGSLFDSSVPIEAVGMQGNFKEIACNGVFSCGLTDNGRVKCWGSNNFMQLGIERVMQSSIPLLISEPGPLMLLNYPGVGQGGYLAITGQNFPETSTITILINNEPVGNVITTISGEFVFFVDTGDATTGEYIVEAVIPENNTSSIVLARMLLQSSADTSFEVSPEFDPHPKEGDGETFILPSQELEILYYFPIFLR